MRSSQNIPRREDRQGHLLQDTCCGSPATAERIAPYGMMRVVPSPVAVSVNVPFPLSV